MKDNRTLSVAKFTRFPGIELPADDGYTGDRFRKDVLIPAVKELEEGQQIVVDLDGTVGYTSAFLREVFDPLAAETHLSPAQLLQKLTIRSSDRSLIAEVQGYIRGRGGKRLVR